MASKKKQCLDMKSLFAAYSAWDLSRREAAGPMRKKAKRLPWRKCKSIPRRAACQLLTEGLKHGHIPLKYLIWVIASRYPDKQAGSLCSCRVQKYTHTPLWGSH